MLEISHLEYSAMLRLFPQNYFFLFFTNELLVFLQIIFYKCIAYFSKKIQ